jgi:hypothetical protein
VSYPHAEAWFAGWRASSINLDGNSNDNLNKQYGKQQNWPCPFPDGFMLTSMNEHVMFAFSASFH